MPIALYQHTESYFWFGPQTFCTEAFPSVSHKRAYILYSFLAVYLLPLITICTCYAFMLKHIGHSAVEPVDGCNQVDSFLCSCMMSTFQTFHNKCLGSSCQATDANRASWGGADEGLQDGGGDGAAVYILLGSHPDTDSLTSVLFWGSKSQLYALQTEDLGSLHVLFQLLHQPAGLRLHGC